MKSIFHIVNRDVQLVGYLIVGEFVVLPHHENLFVAALERCDGVLDNLPLFSVNGYGFGVAGGGGCESLRIVEVGGVGSAVDV